MRPEVTMHWLRSALVGGALLLSMPAHAIGVGTTAGLGSEGWSAGNPFDLGFAFGARGFAPSLDLHFDPILLQLHVLELVDAAADGEVFLGANLYVNVYDADIGGPWAGVIQPGASVDILGDPVILGLAGECRLGMQAEGGMGFGIYVVPAIGVVAGDGDGELYTGGTLQISLWAGEGVGGSGGGATAGSL
jgi:hypothetical protein